VSHFYSATGLPSRPYSKVYGFIFAYNATWRQSDCSSNGTRLNRLGPGSSRTQNELNAKPTRPLRKQYTTFKEYLGGLDGISMGSKVCTLLLLYALPMLLLVGAKSANGSMLKSGRHTQVSLTPILHASLTPILQAFEQQILRDDPCGVSPWPYPSEVTEVSENEILSLVKSPQAPLSAQSR
jgi:hypothetical protein